MRRYKILACMIIFAMISLTVRLFFISYYQSFTVQASFNAGTETFGTDRGLIFDRNMKKLVESEKMTVSSMQNPSFSMKIPNRYALNQLCSHIIGYTDDANNGVCGIEKDFNAYLKAIPNTITLKTYCDARGNLLKGKGTQADTSKQCEDSGICLSIDSQIDSIVKTAGKSLGKGCVAVIGSATGELLAEESFPGFSPNNLESALNNRDLPLINRALCLYNVGSVFKVIVCMAALENGISENFSYCCDGAVHYGGTVFHCHKTDGHGKLTMKQALAFSCNTYFIQLAQKVGAEKILAMCSKLQMNKEISLGDSLKIPSANLPDSVNLTSDAALSNFSFGQGELLCAPLMMANVYAAIQNGGLMQQLHCVNSKVQNGTQEMMKYSAVRVISTKTANKLCEFLHYAVTDGTGKSAQCRGMQIGGKTATAQTGKYVKNKEILISYFIGFISIKGENMVILVMKEGGSSGSGDCAPVFKEIAENIAKIKE